MSNRLARETSPYLLQHAHNPVDWYPWGEEALAKARAEDKPILLSIGYSACHWCHVMERECFENTEIARQMNDGFVCIKVDREERPDLDQIYQNVAQALTRGGGWPLTVFLTPDLKPFFGGTYFPPHDNYGRPGFPRVLKALSEAYRGDRESVSSNAEKLVDFITSVETARTPDSKVPTLEALKTAAVALLSQIDHENGGIGGAPKFPNAMAMSFLWRMGELAAVEGAREAVILTLTKMAEGGIYDQLGGGFHRYSVDATWSVPHFEKMLYDNGLLLKLYAEVLLGKGLSEDAAALFTQVLADTCSYLEREMVSPEGALYAAQDADSEGEEGKYFVWNEDEIRAVLPKDEADLAIAHWGVTPEGNFEHGRTVLHVARSGDPTRLAGAQEKLLATRTKRIAPATDTKCLASWNGLAISGLAWAARALSERGLNEESARAARLAQCAYQAITSRLSREGERLFSTLQQGQAKYNAYLDDYAFMAMAALDLARLTPKKEDATRMTDDTHRWVRTVLARFKNPGGGFYFTSDDHETLIHRPRTLFDQAIPAGSSVIVHCLLALAEIEDPSLSKEAQAQLSALFPLAERSPWGCAELLSSALLSVVGPVTVAGDESSRACAHPFVFRKPEDGPLLVCHRQACSMPLESWKTARNEALSRLTLA